MKKLTSAWVVLHFLLGSHVVSAAREPKVLLKNIQTLTVYKDRMTSSRRVKAMPQLSCVGGSGKGHFQVDVMRCENSGSSYDQQDVEWTCKASLPSEFKLGSTDVVCEGYAYPDDPYVLKGSCAVEYRLTLTDVGRGKYGAGGKGDWFLEGSEAARNPFVEKVLNVLFWSLFVGVGLWIAYAFLASLHRGGRERLPRQPRAPRAGYGGGGFDDDDGPPPPYGDHFGTPWPRQGKPASARASSSAGSSGASRGGQGWTPGFFTGAGLGAAGAYAAGSYLERRRREEAEERTRRQQGGWLGNRFRQDDAGEGPSNTARHESTGFGSTRRR